MEHGDSREGKWRGNWQMQWVASTLHTTSEHGVFSIITADAHNSAASSRLNWHLPPPPPPSRADLKGLVRFAERRNLLSARVSSHFNWPLLYKAYPFLNADYHQFEHWKILHYSHVVFVSFVCISKQTRGPPLYTAKWLVFIDQMKSVYSAVRTGSLNKAVCASSLRG